jgi:hypothetical protein
VLFDCTWKLKNPEYPYGKAKDIFSASKNIRT